MSHEELELMRQLKQLSQCIPEFVLAFANHELAVDAELDFVRQVADMAEGLLRHANSRRGLTMDGEPLPLVVDAEFVRMVEVPKRARSRELPLESTPGDDGRR